MIGLKNIFQLFKVNFRLAFLNNILMAVLLLAFIPIVFSIRNLDFMLAARICEQFIAIVGIIIFVPLFSPEEDSGIRETVEAKYYSQSKIYFLRILTAILITSLLISFEIFLLDIYGDTLDKSMFIGGTIASALFLGALGLFTVVSSGQLAAGYMIPMVYFIVDMMTNGKYTKNFFLFSMMNNSFKEKYYLMAGAVVLIVLVFLSMLLGRNIGNWSFEV